MVTVYKNANLLYTNALSFFFIAVYFGRLLISIVIKEVGFGGKILWREGWGGR